MTPIVREMKFVSMVNVKMAAEMITIANLALIREMRFVSMVNAKKAAEMIIIANLALNVTKTNVLHLAN